MRVVTEAPGADAAVDREGAESAGRRRGPARKIALALAIVGFYTAAAIFMVGPQPVTECTTTVFGGPGDSTAGLIWMLWNYEELDTGPLESTTPLLDAPHGGDLWRPILVTSSAVILPTWAAAQLVGPVCAWNIAVLAGFLLSALSMFGLVRWLTRHTGAALIAGYAFAFSPFAIRKAEGHLDYVHLWIFPLILWAVLWCWRRPSIRRAAAVGVATGFAAYVDGYYLLIASVMTAAIIFTGLIVVASQGTKSLRRYFLLSAVALGATLVVLVPIGTVMVTTSAEVSESVTRRVSDVSTYAARPLEYVVPSRTHPVFSRYFGAWQDQRLHGSNYSEQTLYVGVTVLALGAIALVQALRRGRASSMRIPVRTASVLLVGTAAIAALFSAPARVRLGPVTVPMPSSFVYSLAPYWRVFARFFIPVDAALVVLAGIGVAVVAGRNRMRSAIAVVAIGLVVAFDLLAVPPRPQWSYRADSPRVYKWVGGQDDQGIVANYPMVDAPWPPHLTYLTYQPVHGRPIFNGAEPGEASWELKAGLIGLADPQTIPALRRLGVTTVIVHHEYYEPFLRRGDAPPPSLVKRFSSEWATAYDIAPGRKSVASLTMSEGFLAAELSGYASQRWMGSTGTLGVHRFTDVDRLTISFEATSFAKPRHLVVTQEGGTVWEGKISESATPVRFTTTSAAPLTLRTSPGAQRIGSVLTHTGDDRVVSIILSKLNATAG